MTTKWNVLTLAQAEELFKKHAFLIGDHDRVPKHVALELFGREAVEFANRVDRSAFSLYGCGGDKQIQYVKHSGFLHCVTYCNCMTVAEEAAKLWHEELDAMKD